MKHWLCLCLGITALAAGCSSGPKSRYAWGSYEERAYRFLFASTTEEVAEDIRVLSAEIEQADAEGRPVPPGVHAHLGYLYAITGNTESAAQQFEIEKRLYPESRVFLDGCLRRMGR